MRVLTRGLLQAAGAALVLAAAAVAQAETSSLELKKFNPLDPSEGVSDRMEYIHRASYPQQLMRQTVPDGKGGVHEVGNEEQEAEFKKIVKKEPKYNSERPFKGVAKLGTGQIAFVLDTSKPEPEPNADKAGAKPEADSAIAKLKEKVIEKTAAPPVVAYDRLYFDVNHNGDLTDDKFITGKVQTFEIGPGQSYASITFPRLDVTIDADGTPMESSVSLSGQIQSSATFNYVGLSITAGAYREGEITLEGKKRHVVLIDFNSNGRFDDEMKARTIVRSPGKEEMYPDYGDMLLVDPRQSKGTFDSPYDVTSTDYRHNVGKLVKIDGRFYDLKITPAGDKLTLEPSTVATGNVTNPNDGFNALIYSDKMFLKISGNKNTPIAVPQGEWKLLSYTINLTETPKPPEPKKEPEKGEKEAKAIAKLAEAIGSLLGGLGSGASSGPRISMVSARASGDYKAVKVVKGETVVLPFGPPYKPVVAAQRYGNQDQVSLEMALVGSTGETCSNMMVKGGRPGKPEFTITDPKGEVVQKGNFEYG